MLRNNSDSKISSIIGPEVEVDGDVRVVGSILIYGKINVGKAPKVKNYSQGDIKVTYKTSYSAGQYSSSIYFGISKLIISI